MIFARLVVVVAALMLSVQVVRNAAVFALSEIDPASAARFWPGHPTTEISLGLTKIARAVRERGSIDARTFSMIYDAAEKAPLSSQPFLVRGVQAQTSGDLETARRAFLAAQWRDPRSLPAAYFLANYYLRTGQSFDGLQQMAILARLSPHGIETVTPFVATYAQNRLNWPQLRSLFRSQPGLEDSVLTVLAENPSNAQAILALAGENNRKPDSPWLRVLLQKLVEAGHYRRAHAFWSAIGGGSVDEQMLYDASFSHAVPPPPFNWSLTSSTIGLAERQPGKGLHVIFYGNEDGVLASELLLLGPGVYRLKMRLAQAPVNTDSLRWSIRCDKSQEPVSTVILSQAASATWLFEVPANCPAQWLELLGRSADLADQSEVTITDLSLARLRTDA